jgi:hypothetical protein
MKHNEMAKWRNQWLISWQRRNHGAISNNGESGSGGGVKMAWHRNNENNGGEKIGNRK